MILSVQLPLRVNANARGHSRFPPTIKLGPWPKMKYRPATKLLFKQRWLNCGIDEAARQYMIDSGLTITLTRIAPLDLDGHDNLRTAMKPVVDGITDALGLKNDRDVRLTWKYDQERAGVREYAVKVSVALRPAPAPCPTCGRNQ